MSVHVSSKPADEASRLPAAAWLVLGIVLVAEVMDLLDSTVTTIAAPTISPTSRRLRARHVRAVRNGKLGRAGPVRGAIVVVLVRPNPAIRPAVTWP